MLAFEKKLNVTLTACSTSFQVNNSLFCVLSPNFETDEDDRWVSFLAQGMYPKRQEGVSIISERPSCNGFLEKDEEEIQAKTS